MIELVINTATNATIIIGHDIASNAVDDLKNVIDNAISRGCIKINLDMTEVQYLNSSALSILIAALFELNSKSGNMELTNVSQYLYRFFDETNLTKLFTVKPD